MTVPNSKQQTGWAKNMSPQKKNQFIFLVIFLNVFFSAGLAIYGGTTLGPWSARSTSVQSMPSETVLQRDSNLELELEPTETAARAIVSTINTPTTRPLVTETVTVARTETLSPTITIDTETDTATAQPLESSLSLSPTITAAPDLVVDPTVVPPPSPTPVDEANSVEDTPVADASVLDADYIFIANSGANFDLYSGVDDGGGGIEATRLYTDGLDLFYPDVDPLRTRLTYHTQASDLNWEIFLLDLNVTDNMGEAASINLSNHPAQDSFARWSPDGSAIIFQSDRVDGQFDIFRIDINLIDDDPLRLTTNEEDDFGPTWSPDGRSIAFHRRLSPTIQEIFLLDLETGAEARVTRRAGISQFPEWSPDGSTLVFQGQVDGRWQLFLLDLTTEAVTQLEGDPRNSFFPRWAPDGESILYHAQVSGENRDLFRVNLANGEVSALTDTDVQERMVVPVGP